MEDKEQAIHKYRVCILTAGKGSRLGNRTTYFNKALLRVGNKAVISHTIDSFPKEVEFVIALGYKGDIVKQYLQIAHPDRKFIFVDVDKYSEPGSGPGYALLKCKEELQCPFYFVSCDSVVLDWWFLLKFWHGWSGYCEVEECEKENYCTIEFNDDFEIVRYFNKALNGTRWAFTGVAFIKEYEALWNNLESENVSVEEEIQVAPSILNIKTSPAVEIDWVDVGCESGLKKAREKIEGIQNLDKLDEELYFVDNSVVKYFHNSSMVTNRVERAKHLGSTIPAIKSHAKNFYKYDFIEGQDFFKIDPHLHLDRLLSYTKENLWKEKKLNEYDSIIFKDVCMKFYYDKTISRMNKLYDKLQLTDEKEIINGVQTSEYKNIFKRINWRYLSEGIPTGFHGDYNFSNILLCADGNFKFLDWRQDFGGLIGYGDIYYDFAKMYHSFLFPHPSVKNNRFYVLKSQNYIKTFIEIPYEIEKAKDLFENFINDSGYDIWKVRVLTAIVLLNMSPLHECPVDEYLYYYSKYYLQRSLNE